MTKIHQLQSFGLPTGSPARENLDESWNEFFRDPSKWWDNRASKRSPTQPDFRHKLTKEPLWMDGLANPSWVKDELLKRRLVVEDSFVTASTADAFLPSLIWACSKNKDLSKGTQIHNELRKRGLLEKNYSDALITMYAKCGELHKAHALLDMHGSSSIIPWTALISSYARKGQGQNALSCFQQMKMKGIPLDVVTYVCVLKACGTIRAIDKGKEVHDEIQRQGLLEHSVELGNALVDMYAKCGDLFLAQNVLEKLPSRDVVTWSTLIAGYAQKGQGQQALKSFKQMQYEGISPNAVTYACILKSCAMIGAIDKGKKIHDEILRQGLLENDRVLGNALVDMYAKCGALSQAKSVLERLHSRDVVSWSALIGGYVLKGQGQQALECFEQMLHEGINPNAVTYVCILTACGLIGAIDKGQEIHNELSRQRLIEHNIELGNALVDMYAKCGALPQAQSVLEKLRFRNVISWSALMAGYAQMEQGHRALECFERMQCEGIVPNAVTYACVLKSCAMVGAIDKGKKIHKEILRQGLLEHDIVLGNALVDMYAKCGALHQAKHVLEKLPSCNIVSWSALIAGYAENGQGREALECFEQMQQEGILPDAITYMCIVKACAMIKDFDKGTQIHNEIQRQGMLEHSVVLGNALVDMYVKCDALLHARNVIATLPCHDIVTWNSLITGYSQEGQGQRVLECLEQMQHEGISPNGVTYVCILKACAMIGAIDKGKQIHNEILREGLLEHDKILGNALVEMYAKCGALVQAKSVSKKLQSHDVVMWNTLISAHAQEGQGEQVFECFEQMQREGILPDIVTFCCLLRSCSHLGLVEKGQELFDSLGAVYGWKLDVECFTCMVDLLGRAGNLFKALEVIQEMPSSANSAIWLCLLSACRKWMDVNVGILAFKQAVELDKCGGAAYALMADIYAVVDMPEKAKEIEAMRIENKAWKQPGCGSWTDSNNMLHEMCVGDTKNGIKQLALVNFQFSN